MKTFRVKEVVKVKMAYIYEVEAETAEEAVEKYNEELIGAIGEEDSFVTNEDEGVTVIDEF